MERPRSELGSRRIILRSVLGPEWQLPLRPLERALIADADGTFVFAGVPAGEYQLVFVDGFANSAGTAESVPLVLGSDVEVTVGPGTSYVRAFTRFAQSPDGASAASLTGRVQYAGTQQAISGAFVDIEGARGWHRRIRTGGNGLFVAEGLPRGSYGISVSKSGFVQDDTDEGGATRVTLREGTRTEILLGLKDAGSVAGTLRDRQGEPLANVEVELWIGRHREGRTEVAPVVPRRDRKVSTRTSTDGSFRMHGLREGIYFVRFSGSAVQEAQRSDALGRVVGALKKRQAPTEKLWSEMLQEQSSIRAVPRRETVPLYYPGTPSIQEAQLVRLSAGEHAALGILQLDPHYGFTIRGRVGGMDGRWQGGLSIERVALGPFVSLLPLTGALTGADFEFSSVPNGSYQLIARGRSSRGIDAWGSATVHVADGDATVDLSMRPTANLRGRLVRPDGQGAGVIDVTLVPTGDTSVTTDRPRAVVDEKGRFQFDKLIPGRYVVEANITIEGRRIRLLSEISGSAVDASQKGVVSVRGNPGEASDLVIVAH
jgi:protocatechuate 3,4-dioxygenase beta subunit